MSSPCITWVLVPVRCSSAVVGLGRAIYLQLIGIPSSCLIILTTRACKSNLSMSTHADTPPHTHSEAVHPSRVRHEQRIAHRTPAPSLVRPHRGVAALAISAFGRVWKPTHRAQSYIPISSSGTTRYWCQPDTACRSVHCLACQPAGRYCRRQDRHRNWHQGRHRDNCHDNRLDKRLTRRR